MGLYELFLGGAAVLNAVLSIYNAQRALKYRQGEYLIVFGFQWLVIGFLLGILLCLR